jgi:hypothetical protein
MRLHVAGAVRSAAFRRKCFSLANTCVVSLGRLCRLLERDDSTRKRILS